jgi:Glycosyl transferase family 2/Cephalosporin hydroxylase
MSDIDVIDVPAPLRSAGIRGHLDRFGPDVIDGWITNFRSPSAPVVIDIVEDRQIVGRITANLWRVDLQEVRQGDGRWGFTCLPPARLADGSEHTVSLVLPDGQVLLPAPIRIRFDVGADRAVLGELRPPAFEPDPPSRSRPYPLTAASIDGTLFSFIVVFYNMRREAARTLTSLTRAYQRGLGQVGYEVICIDNGSAQPLDAAWIEGFGPEFRLVRANPAAPSPVGLINEVARQARGHHLALMIDGAHVLSPGVMREAAEAIAEAPTAAIALRQWFVGGDQRFLARSGWTREQENMLFDRIGWPNDGYGLFRISTPVWESPNHWFDGMSETNCLFIPATLFADIGGFDEAFNEPGAGYANLDLFRRTYEATSEPLVALVGEASFHQFHEGTTTNVEHDEKERRVRAYAFKYACVRGKPWRPIDAGALRLRGQIHTRTALVTRQRPLSPAGVGVTTHVRPADMAVHFDRSARDYLVSVYAEAGLQNDATWRGETLGIAPPDALAIAAILHEIRPTRVVAVHLPPGLLSLLGDMLQLDGAASRFVIVGEGGLGGSPDTDPLAPEILCEVRRALGAATEIVVLYAQRSQDDRLRDALHSYAEFVSLRSYLVVVDSAVGQPWLGYARAWTMKAINSFVDVKPFAIDHSRTQHLITSCPLGFLQRIGPVDAGDNGAGLALVGVS